MFVKRWRMQVPVKCVYCKSVNVVMQDGLLVCLTCNGVFRGHRRVTGW